MLCPRGVVSQCSLWVELLVMDCHHLCLGQIHDHPTPRRSPGQPPVCQLQCAILQGGHLLCREFKKLAQMFAVQDWESSKRDIQKSADTTTTLQCKTSCPMGHPNDCGHCECSAARYTTPYSGIPLGDSICKSHTLHTLSEALKLDEQLQ